MSETRNLYVSTYAPVLGSGRALRTYTCVRALAMLGPLDVAYVTHGGDGPSPEYAAIDGVEFHEIRASRGPRRAALYVSKRLAATPDVCCRGTSPELIAAAERLAWTPGRGQVIVGDTSAATALMGLAARRPVIYNAHNIESEYVRGHFGYRALSRGAMRRYERRLLALAAESWMVSRADLRSARALVPQARLRYAPNVVDVTAIVPRRRPGVGGSRLLMVGDFKYPPNMTGLQFLVGSVLPRVWRDAPQTRLTLVGRGLEEWRASDERIEVAGFVDSLEPLYADADCVVVPLTEGAGTPLKFVEALAYGMPVVATPIAAKGLEVTPDVHFREGADAASFAQAIVEILRDGADQMAAQGRALAEREYSIEALAERLAGPGEEPLAGAPRARALRPAPPARGAAATWARRAAGAGLGHRNPFVLCYHGVGRIERCADPGGNFVSRELFAEHLDVIRAQGYETVTASQLWERMRAGSSGEGLGAITFDDGLERTVHEAMPLLAERGMASSMFVATGLLGRAHPDVAGETIIDAACVRELAEQGVEIGAHTVDHVCLTDIDYAEAVAQMRRSRETLEDLIGRPVTSMAYPFGAYDEQTMRAAAEAGYEVACGCSGPGPWRALSLPREPVFASATPLRLRLKMAGLYGPVYALANERSALRRRVARRTAA